MTALAYISQIGDREIRFGLSDAEIGRFPSWPPEQAIPLTFKQVIEIAAKELPELLHGAKGWYVKGISLEQVLRSPDGNGKWVYLVKFGGIGDNEDLCVPVTFLGLAVKGIEQKQSKEQR